MSYRTPKEIVKELDRFVVGQNDAKRAVAIALRNRWRRKQLPEQMQEEIIPHNILMFGPTGVGKTEIARRMAKLADAPFLKVEATKFTEVGYVGRDVDSIIRDLLDIAIQIVKDRMAREVATKAMAAAEARIVETLLGTEASAGSKEKFYQRLKDGNLDDLEIEIKVNDEQTAAGENLFEIPGMGAQVGLLNISEMLSKVVGGKKQKTLKVKVPEAYKILLREESDKLVDKEKSIAEAMKLTEEDGIVFLDEIDKIASRETSSRGEVSREGVQRDLLPLVEGTVVNTKYGAIKTNHILFIASGAFHVSKPSDLLPELQGRFPIRVQLQSLSESDLIRILQDTEHSIVKQYIAMIAVEGVQVDFTNDGIAKIAHIAIEVNNDIENIGARRLHTVMETLLDEVSFNASESAGEVIVIDAAYVEDRLSKLSKKQDLAKFLL